MTTACCNAQYYFKFIYLQIIHSVIFKNMRKNRQFIILKINNILSDLHIKLFDVMWLPLVLRDPGSAPKDVSAADGGTSLISVQAHIRVAVSISMNTCEDILP